MSDTVRGIAHDLNNVFAAILGSADLLAMRLREADPALEETREIQAAAERGAALVRRLFALGPRPDDATRRARPRSRTTSTTRRKKSSS